MKICNLFNNNSRQVDYTEHFPNNYCGNNYMYHWGIVRNHTYVLILGEPMLYFSIYENNTPNFQSILEKAVNNVCVTLNIMSFFQIEVYFLFYKYMYHARTFSLMWQNCVPYWTEAKFQTCLMTKSREYVNITSFFLASISNHQMLHHKINNKWNSK